VHTCFKRPGCLCYVVSGIVTSSLIRCYLIECRVAKTPPSGFQLELLQNPTTCFEEALCLFAAECNAPDATGLSLSVTLGALLTSRSRRCVACEFSYVIPLFAFACFLPRSIGRRRDDCCETIAQVFPQWRMLRVLQLLSFYWRSDPSKIK